MLKKIQNNIYLLIISLLIVKGKQWIINIESPIRICCKRPFLHHRIPTKHFIKWKKLKWKQSSKLKRKKPQNAPRFKNARPRRGSHKTPTRLKTKTTHFKICLKTIMTCLKSVSNASKLVSNTSNIIFRFKSKT